MATEREKRRATLPKPLWHATLAVEGTKPRPARSKGPPAVPLFACQVEMPFGEWFVDGNIFMKSGIFLNARQVPDSCAVKARLVRVYTVKCCGGEVRTVTMPE